MVVSPSPPADREQRRKDLLALAKCKAFGGPCEICGVLAPQPVHGDGSLQARLIFVSQAPGEKEVQGGRPLIGPTSRPFVEHLWQRYHIHRSEVYMTNAVMCRPLDGFGNDRPPTAAEERACGERLRAELLSL